MREDASDERARRAFPDVEAIFPIARILFVILWVLFRGATWPRHACPPRRVRGCCEEPDVKTARPRGRAVLHHQMLHQLTASLHRRSGRGRRVTLALDDEHHA